MTISNTIIFFIGLFIISKYPMQMLQQNRYNDNGGNRYIKWMLSNKKQITINIGLLYVVTIFLSFINLFLAQLSFILITICIISYILNNKSVDKLPLKYTNRVKRIFAAEYIFNLIMILIIYLNFENFGKYILIYTSIQFYLRYFLIMVPNFMNRPIEKIIALNYKRNALKKLNSLTNLEVIGITGSYGKTSSKNILNDILNVKYNSIATPLNYNTPYGLIITINNYLNKFTDYFVAEMGAYSVGEIDELCKMVKPKYGILTNIGIAHLESFKSIENIQKTKFELIESLPEDGLGILNKDDQYQTSYKLKNNVKINYISINDKKADVFGTNIQISKSGSTFDVYFKNDKNPYKFETKLLGKANIYNILAAIALGKHLGIEIHKLQSAVRNVKQIEHRLEIKKYFDMYLIDDAYNSNPSGAKMALETIALMPGTRVVITPGMIELGEEDEEKHYEFGRQMASSVDYAILIGKNKTKDIYRGLLSENFKEENIYVYNDVLEGFDLLKKLKDKDKDLYALIENDLPDSFKERKN